MMGQPRLDIEAMRAGLTAGGLRDILDPQSRSRRS